MIDTMKLKPCPFCGADAKIQDIRDSDETGEVFGYVEVSCTRCNGHDSGRFAGVHAEDRESAIASWNTRPAAPEAAA